MFLFSVESNAQDCLDYSFNDQNATPEVFVQNKCVTITSNTIIGNLKIGKVVNIKIPQGVTFTINNNIESAIGDNLSFEVGGTLVFAQKPSINANVAIKIESTGVVNVGSKGRNNLEIRGLDNLIYNEGILNVGVVDLIGGDKSYNVIDNVSSGKIFVGGNINIQGNTTFRNYGYLEIEQSYNNNATSSYINCGTIEAKVGFNLQGGKILNTGIFNHGQGVIDLGGKGSELNNFGVLTSQGTINGNNSDIVYNEGRLVVKNMTHSGKFSGPLTDDKLGYVYVVEKINANGMQVGPNLDFRKISNVNDITNFNKNSDFLSVFNNNPPKYYNANNQEVNSAALAGVTYGCTNCKAPEIIDNGTCYTLNGEVEKEGQGICTKEPKMRGAVMPSDHGIFTQKNPVEDWQEYIPNAQLVISSSTKGLVITRTVAEKISRPVIGMIIYDTEDKCIKLYSKRGWNCITKSCNDGTVE